MTRTLAAPFQYFGGKQQLAPRIVALMPPHDCYIEPFFGAGAVLFAKPPAKVEVVNDLDSGIVAFFRVLRDETRAKKLAHLLELTAYAREEWEECRKTWRNAPDEVEMARRWFVATQQAFAGRTDGSPSGPGWRFTRQPSHNPAASFRSATARFTSFARRMALVQVEHKDALAVIQTYDGPNALIYADPPYIHETRRGGGYAREMTLDDHARLLDVLCGVRGMVILSGYSHPLYSERLGAWECLQIEVACSAAGRTKRAKLQGTGAIYKAGQTRTECLWLNPACVARRHDLFSRREVGA